LPSDKQSNISVAGHSRRTKPTSAIAVEFKRGTRSHVDQIWTSDEDPFASPMPGVIAFPRIGEKRGYRMMRAEEAPQLFALHRKVWGDENADALEARWPWLLANPHAEPGEEVVPVYVQKGKIRAYQITVPQRFRVHGKPWRVYLVGSLTGDPESRGGVLRLHNFFFDHFPVSFWGWVSDALALYQRTMGDVDYAKWKGPSPPLHPEGVPEEHASRRFYMHWNEPRPLVRPLRADPYLKFAPLAVLANAAAASADRWLLRSNRSAAVEEVERFPESFGPWLDATVSAYAFILDRDVAYLNWRFHDFPSATYRRFLFSARQTGQPIGYVIVEEVIGPRGHPAWEIADLLTGADAYADLRAILATMLKLARRAGATSVRVRDPEHPGRQAEYRRLGFRPRGTEDRHVIYWRPPATAVPAELYDRSNWPISWADADPRLV
jgi:hypothetical protein